VWAGIAISITLLGWGIGGLVGGTLADYIGRKRMMLYSGGRRKLRWLVWFSSPVAVRSTSASGTR
jgi:MFS family permease